MSRKYGDLNKAIEEDFKEVFPEGLFHKVKDFINEEIECYLTHEAALVSHITHSLERPLFAILQDQFNKQLRDPINQVDKQNTADEYKKLYPDMSSLLDKFVSDNISDEEVETLIKHIKDNAGSNIGLYKNTILFYMASENLENSKYYPTKDLLENCRLPVTPTSIKKLLDQINEEFNQSHEAFEFFASKILRQQEQIEELEASNIDEDEEDIIVQDVALTTLLGQDYIQEEV